MKIPEGLLDGLSPEQRAKTEAWWETLKPGAQAEFCRLWDERSEDTAYVGVTHDGELEWHELPIELVGNFVDEQNAIELLEGKADLYEYLCEHPEHNFFLTDRVFHLGCRAHERAREALRTGWLPHDFECPFSDADCPMRRVLDTTPGKSLRLRVVVNERWFAARAPGRRSAQW